MIKRVLIAAGLVAALTGAAAVATAQGPQGGPGLQGGPGGRGARDARGLRRVGPGADLGLRGIALTEAQREQVRSIRESHKAEFDAVRQKLREAHRAFAEATRGESVDESTIRSRSTAVAAAMADDAILRAKVRAEVHGILTAEQQQQLKDRQAQVQKRLQERSQRQPRRPGQ